MTDTLKLQRSGWDLAVQHDINYDRYVLLMQHEQMRLNAISDALKIDRALHEVSFRAADYPIFHVRHVAPTFQSVRTSVDFSGFQQIDAAPRFVETEIQCLEDFNIFALARGKAEEILVNRADMSVIEHLEAIKRLQEPKQHELRERSLSQRSAPTRQAPRLHLVAQLVHLEEAA